MGVANHRTFPPRIRILLTTGYADSSDGVNQDAGAEFEILKKPYRLADLDQRVRHVLDSRHTAL